MEMKDFVIMVVVLAIVSTATGILLFNFNAVYGDNANISRFNDTFENFEGAYELYNDTASKAMDSGELTESDSSTVYSFSVQVWSAIKGLVTAPVILMGLMTDTLEVYGVGWVGKYLLTLMVVTLLFMMIYFFWRWRG